MQPFASYEMISSTWWLLGDLNFVFLFYWKANSFLSKEPVRQIIIYTTSFDIGMRILLILCFLFCVKRCESKDLDHCIKRFYWLVVHGGLHYTVDTLPVLQQPCVRPGYKIRHTSIGFWVISSVRSVLLRAVWQRAFSGERFFFLCVPITRA